MKRYQKTLLCTATICSMIGLIGCSSQTPDTPVGEQDTNVTVEADKHVSSELLTYMPKDLENSYFYEGEQEYGHELVIESVENTDTTSTYKLKGSISENSTVKDPSNSFAIDLVVDSEKVVFKSDYKWMPIEEFTALKLPIALNTEWTEEVGINGSLYDATSKIISLDDTDSGRVVTVITTAEGVDGFKNNTYIQKVTFKEDLGIFNVENDYLYKDYTGKFKQNKLNYTFVRETNR